MRLCRALLGSASLAIACVGCVQLAEGAWIFAKAALAQHLLESAWAQTRTGEERVAPWPWADTWPVARLVFPRLETSFVVLSGASGRTLAFGPGHTTGSAQPGGRGTAIISGHRDTHFALLRSLVPGDVVEVERPDGGIARYRVHGAEVLDSRNGGLRAEPEGSTLVLVTCWPFDALRPGGPFRYVVTADREPAEPIEPTEQAERAVPALRDTRSGVIGSVDDSTQAEVLGLGLRG